VFPSFLISSRREREKIYKENEVNSRLPFTMSVKEKGGKHSYAMVRRFIDFGRGRTAQERERIPSSRSGVRKKKEGRFKLRSTDYSDREREKKKKGDTTAPYPSSMNREGGKTRPKRKKKKKGKTSNLRPPW